jgi:hypothetical protein
MTLDEALADARRVFPNFPPELFTLWLDPCIRHHGWPPRGFAWDGFLFSLPLAFWQSVRWQEDSGLVLQPGQLGHKSAQLSRLITEAGSGQRNLLSQHMPDTGQRFRTALAHVEREATTPGRPLLLVLPEGIEVIDGSHRVAALLAAQARQPLQAPLRFTAWVGRPPPP